MRINIYFAGGGSLSLNAGQISEPDLHELYLWSINKSGGEIKTIKYDMNGTAGQYIIYRENIAYINIQED